MPPAHHRLHHLDNHSVADFIRNADLDAPLVVVCYHGNSSQSAAAYLISQGFSDVYSMDGGFELWRTTYPAETAQGAPNNFSAAPACGLAPTDERSANYYVSPLTSRFPTILKPRPSKTGRAGTPACGSSVAFQGVLG
jgi:3-mercaptopyruvate sulfurtransferase SseA